MPSPIPSSPSPPALPPARVFYWSCGYKGVVKKTNLLRMRFGLAVRLALLVELEPQFCLFQLFFREIVGRFQGFFLRFDGLVKLAVLSISGGQRVEESSVFELGQLARFLGICHGFFAIAQFGLGASGPNPGQTSQGFRIVGMELQGLLEISDTFLVFSLFGTGLGPTDQRPHVLGMELEDMAVIGNGFVVLFFLHP